MTEFDAEPHRLPERGARVDVVAVDPPTPSANVAALIHRAGARWGTADALIVARTGERYSFEALSALTARAAAGLSALGIVADDRIVVMVKPGPRFVAVIFALASLGAVPVLFDPGLGLGRMFDLIGSVNARGIVAERLFFLAGLLGKLPRVDLRVSMGWWPGAIGWDRLVAGDGRAAVCHRAPEQQALLAFTSGSTGVPKAVSMSHRALRAQVRALAELGAIGPGDVQIAILPLVAVLGPVNGCATVIPDIPFSNVSRLRPARLVEAMERFGVTHGFGSPRVWSMLATHCERRKIVLTGVKQLLIGGAPGSPALLRALGTALGERAVLQTPYGSTEAAPLTTVTGQEILAEVGAGRGLLVGRPLAGVEVKIIDIVAGPITDMSAARVAPVGEIGEVVVRSAVAASGYEGGAALTASARIDAPGGPWHRMGDLGRLDAHGRLWFLGRMDHRIQVGGQTMMCPVELEPAFAAHPEIEAAAIVGIGSSPAQRPVLIAQPSAPLRFWQRSRAVRLKRELLAIAAGDERTRAIDRVLFVRSMPVDVRHRAKILRGQLATWAQGLLS